MLAPVAQRVVGKCAVDDRHRLVGLVVDEHACRAAGEQAVLDRTGFAPADERDESVLGRSLAREVDATVKRAAAEPLNAHVAPAPEDAVRGGLRVVDVRAVHRRRLVGVALKEATFERAAVTVQVDTTVFSVADAILEGAVHGRLQPRRRIQASALFDSAISVKIRPLNHVNRR